ncbi:MAG: hypothetical protein JWO51_23 [Rhodospirillales bacterium]|nr:hypothetical protein [Rhodospirillales bacterium]
MRRPLANSFRVRPHRFGAVPALVALLIQLLLPSAAAFAMGDPLGSAPICTTGAHHTGGPDGPHKALHAVCPLCQAHSVAWSFVPPVQSFVLGPQRRVGVIWRQETPTIAPTAVASLRARGPPVAA